MKTLLSYCLVTAYGLSFSTVAMAKSDSFSFAIVPQQSASKLAKKWVPICKYLSEKTGVKINFETAPIFLNSKNGWQRGATISHT